MNYKNKLNQPIGAPLQGWFPPPLPPRTPMEGRYCRLEPLNVQAHGVALHAAYQYDREGRVWTYLPTGPFADLESYLAHARAREGEEELRHFTIVTPEHGAVGTAAYLRMKPATGSIEVGYITFSPLLQQTVASTEAMYLMMRRAFELGYRRYEWKCDALNAPSMAAAARLGFVYEGIFRQATHYKGRNRDTAWFSIVDKEWPARKAALEAWLAPENFDVEGRQRAPLVRASKA